ncbi:hypothetical protein [Pedobacter gandavensis]|uniref:TerB family tellurite resistance protein n=1 Tax=Pedobacter gandavensis TaxID=2679963 RepID=A0ABR6EV82_9SPHI|nr:hypothetical protein [Pedobacter gandavensis]MBB2149183.1 hypothetical protein [Pedobacter gandavensis]
MSGTKKSHSETKKQEKNLLQFGLIKVLTNLLPGFKTPTYADMLRIDGLMKKFQSTFDEEQAHIISVYEQNNLPKEEDVNPNHPLFRQINEEFSIGLSSLALTEIQKFTLSEFNNSVDGLAFNYHERSLLQKYLVIEEKV